MLCFVGLLRCDLGKAFVAKLYSSLHGTITHQDGLLSIGGSNHSIHAQVNAEDWSTRMPFVGNFTHDLDAAIGQPHFHHSTWQSDPRGQPDRQPSRSPTWQSQGAVANLCPLVREDHLPKARCLVRIRVGLAVLAQRLCGGNSLTEIRDDLLRGLRVQDRELTLDLLLQLSLRRPLAALLTGGRMPFNKPGPQTACFQADSRLPLPVLPRFREPVYFYRAITHGLIMAHGFEKAMAKAVKAFHLLPLKRRSFHGLKPRNL
jgi:hypothetical protein